MMALIRLVLDLDTPTVETTCEPWVFADYVSPDHTCYAPGWVGECDVETMQTHPYDPTYMHAPPGHHAAR